MRDNRSSAHRDRCVFTLPKVPELSANNSPTNRINRSRGVLMSDAVQSSLRGAPLRIGGNTPANIVGVGAVTGFGWGTKHLWDGFLLGESAVKLTGGLDGYVDGGQAYLSLIADEGDRRD